MSGRRLLAGVLVALLVCAAGLVSAHGHLDADHPPCATCTLASARAQIAAPPSVLPVPLEAIVLPRLAVATAAPHTRPPLDTAPKHGPPTPA